VCAALQQLLDPRGSGGGTLIESIDADGWRVLHHAAKAGLTPSKKEFARSAQK
jgi:hypothetical protein